MNTPDFLPVIAGHRWVGPFPAFMVEPSSDLDPFVHPGGVAIGNYKPIPIGDRSGKHAPLGFGCGLVQAHTTDTRLFFEGQYGWVSAPADRPAWRVKDCIQVARYDQPGFLPAVGYLGDLELVSESPAETSDFEMAPLSRRMADGEE